MLRRLDPPRLLGFGAAFVGVVGIVSALTPEIASRSDLVGGILPPESLHVARTLVLAFGLALVWLSRGLARRRRRAWLLAVALVVASAVLHLAKGLDFEESVASILLLAALWRWRREFTAPGDRGTLRPLLVVLAALAGVLLVQAWDDFPVSDRIGDALTLLAVGLGFQALYFWLRPFAQRVRQTEGERKQAERIVRERGRDSLCFFSLRRDKSWFFSPSGRSFLAYRVIAGTALVSGDPIGEANELAELVTEFRRVCHAQGRRVAVAGASDAALPLYRALGLHAIYIGDEAVVDPRTFSLEGRAIRKVRQSVSRLDKAGYRVRIVPAAEAEPELRAELEAVSEEWRGAWPERGFTMTMDALFAPDSVLALAQDGDGRIGGFLQLVPAPASGGWSLATMRRRRSTPNGLMEFLIVEAIEWARDAGATEVSLNFAVFADVLRDGPAALARRALRFALMKLDRLFQLERLFSFNRKFHPSWRRRYLVVERYGDVPLVGLAYLQAESLLTPPRTSFSARPTSKNP